MVIVRVPIASSSGFLFFSAIKSFLIRSRIASERFVYPSFLIDVSNFFIKSGSIDIPNLVIFSAIVTRLTDKSNTNLNFLLPKLLNNGQIFSCHKIKKMLRRKYIMWLVTTLIAAIAVTAIWYVKPKIYKLDILSLMLWGTSIMILVDHIIGYEGGEFIEFETDGLITSGTLLGIVMLIPIFVLWEVLLIISKPKEKKSIGGN